MNEQTRVDGYCETCRWFCQFSRRPGGTGKCKCGPPTIGPKNADAIWPVVMPSDWCGQYEKREADG